MLLETGLLNLKKSFLPSLPLILAITNFFIIRYPLRDEVIIIVLSIWEFDLELVVVISYHEQR